jgi:serine/threonine-protein kinase RsbW
MSIWWTLHLRREAASVPLARRVLLGTMETAGVEPDICYDLSIALTEACANAVEHGGGGLVGGSSGEFQVNVYLDGEVCRIEVTDSGPGFPQGRVLQRTAVRPPPVPPSTVPPAPPAPVGIEAENGRGMCLIEAFADHVAFGNTPGSGAVVSFDKILKWRQDALLRAS